MKSNVKAIPEGYNTLTPCFTVKDAKKAIDFYKKAFGATEVMRFDSPDGKVAHAELKIGDSRIMLGDECAEMKAPQPGQTPPGGLYMYVEDVDAVLKKAVEAGATLEKQAEDQFYGDRTAAVIDPFGYTWYLGTHVEDVSEDELRRRFDKMMKQQPQKKAG